MIILTNKRLDALKEEIKADLRREIAARLSEARNTFTEAFESIYRYQVTEIVADCIQGEEFVDEVISRINRKQLVQR